MNRGTFHVWKLGLGGYRALCGQSDSGPVEGGPSACASCSAIDAQLRALKAAIDAGDDRAADDAIAELGHLTGIGRNWSRTR